VQYADVLLASHEANRPVFAVAVGMAGGRKRRSRYMSFQAYRRDASYGDSLQDQLAEISRVSGGQLVTQRDIGDGYAEVLALLRGYYVLGYRTPEPIAAGWHGVSVEVPGDYATVTQPGVFRTETDYSTVRGALRTATESMGRDPETALRMLDLASQLAPEMAIPAFGRGVALERLGRLEPARDAYERALSLSPGAAEVRSRLARIALRTGDYPTAWTQALRLERAGYDADEVLDRLRIIANEPSDASARRRGPRVSLPKPLVPDLEAQLALRPLWRQIGQILEEDPSVTLVPYRMPADFVIHMDLRKLDARVPRRLDLRLQAIDVYEGNEEEARVAVPRMEDAAALRAALRQAVARCRQWMLERIQRRR